MIRVDLTYDEMLFATLIGATRQLNDVRAGLQNKHGLATGEGRDFQCNIEGAIGECTVAKLTCRYWNGAIGNFKADDVGHLQVRLTYRPRGSLIVRPPDRDDRPFVLVQGGSGFTFHVVGWMMGRDAKVRGEWKAPNGRAPAWFVAPHLLTPINHARDVPGDDEEDDLGYAEVMNRRTINHHDPNRRHNVR
jgi:hypothetical protein